MAMRKRPRSRQQELFVQTSALPKSPGHPFCEKLNEILAAHGFDDFIEELCASSYADKLGRPSIPPGVYFRMLMVGYFEGLGSERGIDWRVADSLSLRQFLGYDLTDSTPDHSSLSRIRQRLSLEVHQEVFNWIGKVLAKEGLLKGKTLAVGASTLEATAALRSIVRRDSGEGYEEFLEGLAKASGIDTPTRQEAGQTRQESGRARALTPTGSIPMTRTPRIAKMKDGRTHLAHKSEHVVDLETHAIVAINLSGDDEGDTESLPWSLMQASWNLEEAAVDDEASKQLAEQRLAEVVTDKGYHSNEVVKTLHRTDIRSYLSEPDRGRRQVENRPGSAGRRLRQSTTHSPRARKEVAESASRVYGTQFHSHL